VRYRLHRWRALPRKRWHTRFAILTHFEACLLLLLQVISANPDFDLRATGCIDGELFHERGGEPGSQSRDGLQGVALVRCFPKSGRTHQIRLHLAHLGHPLVGDEIYGVTGPWIGRQALHARALQVSQTLIVYICSRVQWSAGRVACLWLGTCALQV
jgi:hypothetical protein